MANNYYGIPVGQPAQYTAAATPYPAQYTAPIVGQTRSTSNSIDEYLISSMFLSPSSLLSFTLALNYLASLISLDSLSKF